MPPHANNDHHLPEDDDLPPRQRTQRSTLAPILDEFGPCCACGQVKPTVRNIIMLKKRLPAEELAKGKNSAWGCFECGLPPEGASAVVCDDCLHDNVPIQFAVLGYVDDPEYRRIALDQLTEPFDHHPDKHPPVDASMVDVRQIRKLDLTPGADHCPVCGQKLRGEVHTVEVHNAWTIHGMNPDGTEAGEKMATYDRPQDWGDPRWSYHYFRLEFDEGGSRIIGHAHCWTDLKRKSHEYREMFAPLIVQVMMPGRPAELCGEEYLDEDDFWNETWGPLPPYFDESEEDDFYGEDERDPYDPMEYDTLFYPDE